MSIRGLRSAFYAARSAHTARSTQHGPAVQARRVHGTVWRGGVMDKMRGAMDTAMQRNQVNNEEAAFKSQMTYLEGEQRIDGSVYLETLGEMKKASGLSGFREHLPWVSNNPMLEDIKSEERILGMLSPAERQRADCVPISAVKRVARELNVELDQVEMVLQRVVMMRSTQLWVQRLKKERRALPTSSTEMQNMMAAPGNGLRRPRSYQKGHNPGLTKKFRKRYRS